MLVAAESGDDRLARLLVSPAFAHRRPFNSGMMSRFDLIRGNGLDRQKLRRGFELAWNVAASKLADILTLDPSTAHPHELDVVRACEWVLCLSARVYGSDFRTAFADLWRTLSLRAFVESRHDSHNRNDWLIRCSR
jgi:hypothetical protein